MIEASAPVRICDIGGWTDTWFGGPGRVLNIAVAPGVDVSICATAGPDPVVIDVESFGDRYPVVAGRARVARHPLVEAAIDALTPPADRCVEISVRSAVPAGCSTGTSAAVAVALLGGLAHLRADPSAPTAAQWRRDIAYAAHGLEVGLPGGQSGIQDQLCAALGGINYLEIEAFPDATVHPLPTWEALGGRLTLVYLGRAHDSSTVHRQVIERGGSWSGPSTGSGALARLRQAAVAARDAVVARDLDAFGQAMIANTDAQRSLHTELVGRDASRVIETAAAKGAVGWKVNGAGGDGGSVTVLSRTPAERTALEGAITSLDRRYQVLAVHIDTGGLQVRGTLGHGEPVGSPGPTS